MRSNLIAPRGVRHGFRRSMFVLAGASVLTLASGCDQEAGLSLLGPQVGEEESSKPGFSGIIGPNEVFRIRLTTLRCNDAQEEGFGSSYGDEPYVILATIAPGGLAGPRLLFQRTSVINDADDGETFTINLNQLNEHVEDAVVVVAQVVEHDDSSIDLIYNSATGAAQLAFGNAILNGTTDPWTLGGIVGPALTSGVNAAALPLVDDDDAIGSSARFIASRQTFDDLAVGGASTVSRQVAGDGATYTMSFQIRRMQ